MKKRLFPLFGAGLVLSFIILGCTRVDFTGSLSDPVMSTGQIQAELARLHQINLTVGDGEFDPSIYPAFVGIDVRNGKVLLEKFICWDSCPDVGMVFLLYENVGTEEECVNAVGSPLISPDPIPGDYWGCRPIVDWLSMPGRVPG